MEQKGGVKEEKEKKKKIKALTFLNELMRDCHFSVSVACFFSFFFFLDDYQKKSCEVILTYP